LRLPVGDLPGIADTLRRLPGSDPFDRAVREIRDAMGSAEPYEPGPCVPGEPWFHVAVFLTLLPDVLDYHVGRGVPEDVSWETLADLGDKTVVHRRLFGTGGTKQYMVQQSFRGVLYRLGRLQFTRHGGGALEVHIPDGGPLLPEDSYARAAAFFPRHFPDDRRPELILTCRSWLLDPQLAEYLPAEGHILGFQRAYTVEPLPPDPVGDGGITEGDTAIVEFVFRRVAATLDDVLALPRRTALERAVVDHIRAGRHWQVPEGSLRLEAAPWTTD
jgi:hypothetical protein